jgi:hypothetical protein
MTLLPPHRSSEAVAASVFFPVEAVQNTENSWSPFFISKDFEQVTFTNLRFCRSDG